MVFLKYFTLPLYCISSYQKKPFYVGKNSSSKDRKSSCNHRWARVRFRVYEIKDQYGAIIVQERLKWCCVTLHSDFNLLPSPVCHPPLHPSTRPHPHLLLCCSFSNTPKLALNLFTISLDQRLTVLATNKQTYFQKEGQQTKKLCVSMNCL